METTAQDSATATTFNPGESVIYGLHGRCQIISVENKAIGGESRPFYKLEVQKPALSRSTRPEPAIWIPVNSARDRGLRTPIDNAGVEQVFQILSSREYYFSLSDSWSVVQPKLEATIRAEGAIGLAKAYSFLTVLKRKLIVFPPEITRFYETVSRTFLRELSDVLQESMRSLEDRTIKMTKGKSLPDH